MTEIQYLAPATLDEAVSAYAAAAGAARILAGGTDLLVQMRSGVVRPGLIVDIKKIPELTGVEETADGGFKVGAAVPPWYALGAPTSMPQSRPTILTPLLFTAASD